jgi:hypothetical protein
MDDFTFVHPERERCDEIWSASCSFLKGLGFALSQGPGKTEAPATQKVSLGLQIDSVAMTVSLCPVKLAKLAAACSEILKLTRVSRKQFEKLLGFLRWVRRVIYAGRT